MSAPEIAPSETRSLIIRGQFDTLTFCDWIAHRAALLSLSGWVIPSAEGVLEVRVSGNPILLEAMETACSLGPLDAHVESIEVRQAGHGVLRQGFVIR